MTPCTVPCSQVTPDDSRPLRGKARVTSTPDMLFGCAHVCCNIASLSCRPLAARPARDWERVGRQNQPWQQRLWYFLLFTLYCLPLLVFADSNHGGKGAHARTHARTHTHTNTCSRTHSPTHAHTHRGASCRGGQSNVRLHRCRAPGHVAGRRGTLLYYLSFFTIFFTTYSYTHLYYLSLYTTYTYALLYYLSLYTTYTYALLYFLLYYLYICTSLLPIITHYLYICTTYPYMLSARTHVTARAHTHTRTHTYT